MVCAGLGCLVWRLPHPLHAWTDGPPPPPFRRFHPSSTFPQGLFTELSALRKKYDDLVAYSVDVTADRDRLNGMVQKLKADVKRSEGVTRTVLAPEGAAETTSSSEKVEAKGGFNMTQVGKTDGSTT